MQTSWFLGLGGGALIGLAASIALLVHGRVAGISGIFGGALADDEDRGRAFRLAFLAGLFAVGIVAHFAAPAHVGSSPASLPLLAVAGVLVGLGTTLSNGCTSGHGVCGLSRGSPRSLVAVVTFMLAAAVTVAVASRVA